MAAHPEAIVDARFAKRELTLWIARDSLVAAGLALRNAGYNFLSDVSCVDWYPNEPRFEVVYHLLSHGFEGARSGPCGTSRRTSSPEVGQHHFCLALGPISMSAKSSTFSEFASAATRTCGGF